MLLHNNYCSVVQILNFDELKNGKKSTLLFKNFQPEQLTNSHFIFNGLVILGIVTRLCRSAWVGYFRVSLFVCLPRDTLQELLFWGSKVKVTG